MKVALFSAKDYEKPLFREVMGQEHELAFYKNQLRADTAVLADGAEVVVSFVNDCLDQACLEQLREQGVKLIALRCAGYNHVDLKVAEQLGLKVVRVPEYSPYAVAEHALALLLAVNRHIHKAYARVRENNFALHGLMGFDLKGKTIGVIGTGKIGRVFCDLLSGFGCEVIAYDPYPNEELSSRGVEYVELPELMQRSKVISLHCPLTPETHHLINDESLGLCSDGVVLVNTSRGALVDSKALIRALKSKKVGAVALDVYEEEAGIFFEDLSDQVIEDDVLMRLMTFPNVLMTSHQAFFTQEAMVNIADTTAANVRAFIAGEPLVNEVKSS
ncbi:D-lactate dehydrogenase [Rubritalea halochordaticola]|uniref:D-lactate dehydrogenase n=1 Tax=Rubritalea halochordaticola TaxID=714537 RepID=A0ABP9UYJ2_9BACT